MNALFPAIVISIVLIWPVNFAGTEQSHGEALSSPESIVWNMENPVGVSDQSAQPAQTTPENLPYPIENRSSNPGLIAGAVVLVLVIIAGVAIHNRSQET